MSEHVPTPDRVPDDELFAARFRHAWGRPELNAVAQAEFDLRLEARRHARSVRLVPALVGAAVVAALVAAVWVSRTERREDDGFLASLTEAQALASADQASTEVGAEQLAWADVGADLWPNDVGRGDGLSEHLSSEYRSLAALIFPVATPASDE